MDFDDLMVSMSTRDPVTGKYGGGGMSILFGGWVCKRVIERIGGTKNVQKKHSFENSETSD